MNHTAKDIGGCLERSKCKPREFRRYVGLSNHPVKDRVLILRSERLLGRSAQSDSTLVCLPCLNPDS